MSRVAFVKDRLEAQAKRAGLADTEPLRDGVSDEAWHIAVRAYARLFSGVVQIAAKARERGLTPEAGKQLALAHLKVTWLAEDV